MAVEDLAEVSVSTTDGRTVAIRPGSLVTGRNADGVLEVARIRTGGASRFTLDCRVPGGSRYYVELVPSWDLTGVLLPGESAPAQLSLWGSV